MKKAILALVLVLAMVQTVLAGPVISVGLIGDGDQIYTESKFKPLVFLNGNTGGRVLFDDPYGFYANGNIETRPANYVFTGEQMQWKVLVWDKNGVPEKIADVYAGWAEQLNGPIAPEIQVNCQHVGKDSSGETLAEMGYPNVRREIDQEPQVTYNEQTMSEYVCLLTVEPSAHGQKWVGITVIDNDGLTGSLKEAESWFMNPVLDLDVSGQVNFGTLGPGEQGSSTISVKNAAETNSGVSVVLSIAGKDFTDPSSSGALCPTSNQLKLQGDQLLFKTGFWYTATQGNKQVGPKRIPYGDTIVDSDPIFSTSTQAQQWRKWTGTLVPTSTGSSTTLTLHMGLPIPCNGQFTTGQINLFAWAI